MKTQLFRGALASMMLLTVCSLGCAAQDDDDVDASGDAVTAGTAGSKQQLACSGSVQWSDSGGAGYYPQGASKNFGAVTVSLTIENPKADMFKEELWDEAVNKLVQATTKHDDKDLGKVVFRVAEPVDDMVNLRGKIGKTPFGMWIPVKALGKSGELKEEFRVSWSAQGGQADGTLKCTSKLTKAK